MTVNVVRIGPLDGGCRPLRAALRQECFDVCHARESAVRRRETVERPPGPDSAHDLTRGVVGDAFLLAGDEDAVARQSDPGDGRAARGGCLSESRQLPRCRVDELRGLVGLVDGDEARVSVPSRLTEAAARDGGQLLVRGYPTRVQSFASAR